MTYEALTQTPTQVIICRKKKTKLKVATCVGVMSVSDTNTSRIPDTPTIKSIGAKKSMTYKTSLSKICYTNKNGT